MYYSHRCRLLRVLTEPCRSSRPSRRSGWKWRCSHMTGSRRIFAPTGCQRLPLPPCQRTSSLLEVWPHAGSLWTFSLPWGRRQPSGSGAAANVFPLEDSVAGRCLHKSPVGSSGRDLAGLPSAVPANASALLLRGSIADGRLQGLPQGSVANALPLEDSVVGRCLRQSPAGSSG